MSSADGGKMDRGEECNNNKNNVELTFCIVLFSMFLTVVNSIFSLFGVFHKYQENGGFCFI